MYQPCPKLCPKHVSTWSRSVKQACEFTVTGNIIHQHNNAQWRSGFAVSSKFDSNDVLMANHGHYAGLPGFLLNLLSSTGQPWPTSNMASFPGSLSSALTGWLMSCTAAQLQAHRQGPLAGGHEQDDLILQCPGPAGQFPHDASIWALFSAEFLLHQYGHSLAGC